MTYEELLALAKTIKDATQIDENTAIRVGVVLGDIIQYFQEKDVVLTNDNYNSIFTSFFPSISYGSIPAYQGGGYFGSSGIYSSFSGIRFSEDVYLGSYVEFQNDVNFYSAAHFNDTAVFTSDVRFLGDDMRFDGDVVFNNSATFNSPINGTRANFSGRVEARGGLTAINFTMYGIGGFYGPVTFNDIVTFGSSTTFNNTIFGTSANFSEGVTIDKSLTVDATGGSIIMFGSSYFNGYASLNGGFYAGGDTSFANRATFNGSVHFNSISPLSSLSDSTRLVGLQTSGYSQSITIAQLKTYLGL